MLCNAVETVGADVASAFLPVPARQVSGNGMVGAFASCLDHVYGEKREIVKQPFKALVM